MINTGWPIAVEALVHKSKHTGRSEILSDGCGRRKFGESRAKVETGCDSDGRVSRDVRRDGTEEASQQIATDDERRALSSRGAAASRNWVDELVFLSRVRL